MDTRGLRVVVVDNYDSFTYNLAQHLGRLGAATMVRRNDEITVDEIVAAAPTHLVVSPGPGTPDEAGVSMAAIARLAALGTPVLGVCLGHQAVAQVYGGRVRRAARPVHGKTDAIGHDGHGVFAGLPSPFTATRYHSLVVDDRIPDELELAAWTADGAIMGVRHRELPVHGVQFHPESILTPAGLDLLRNFLEMGRADHGATPRHERKGQDMPNDVISRALARLAAAEDLSEQEAREVLLEIMGGRAGETQTAAFLSALRVKGETAEEIVGMARAMTSLAEKVDVDADVILDTCGTGGDGAQTFNVSTAAALVAAGAGATVAKHGNRSATSRCGSADVLEALGVAIDLPPYRVSRCIAETGIGFLFAPRHHLAMRHVAPVRRELGMATTFNLIGPLTNPAGARHQLIGVADRRYVDRIARAVRLMGSARNLVVHSADGLDEISTTAETLVVEVRAGEDAETRYEVTPEQFGFGRARLEELRGGDAELNAALVRDVLDGAPGPRLDIVLLNAGAALYIGERATSIGEGVATARAAVESGAARAKLDALVATSRRLAAEADEEASA